MKSLVIKIVSIISAVTIAGAGAFIAVTKPFSKNNPKEGETTTSQSVSVSLTNKATTKATTKTTTTTKPTTTTTKKTTTTTNKPTTTTTKKTTTTTKKPTTTTTKKTTTTTKKPTTTTTKKTTTTTKKPTTTTTTTKKTTTTTKKPTTTASIGGVIYDAGFNNQAASVLNSARRAAGVADLRYDSGIAKVAALRAKELATNFSHTRPNGDRFFSAYADCGVTKPLAVAENIAAATRFDNAADIVNLWLNSPDHKANITNSKYTRFGMAWYKAGGKEYAVILFGNG